MLIKDNCFYTLCYQTYLSNSILQLYEFNLSDGTHRKLGNGIPIISEKRAAHAELYYDDTVNHLIAVVFDTQDYHTFNTSVYALNWPPTSATQMEQSNKSRFILVFSVSMVIFSIGFLLLMCWRICRRKKTLSEYESEKNSISNASSFRKNAIYLFGDFTVIDSNGADISSRFSPKLKDILVLIIAKTIESDGISSVKLSSRIWPELMWENSKNIRNVTINSLRKALNDVEGFKIVFENERYKVSLEDTCFCDLLAFAKIFKNPSRDNIDLMISILNRGPFLKNASTELSDELKAKTENDVITLLETQMPEYYQSGNYARASYMALDLLAIDPIHEKALAVLIKSYRKLNKNAEAIMAYQEFIKEYQLTFEEKYPVAYRDI
jgi:DNA-binding SARP family transcriptional activator